MGETLASPLDKATALCKHGPPPMHPKQKLNPWVTRIALVLAIPLLYLLSVPWMEVFGRSFHLRVEAVEAYGWPYKILKDTALLEKPLGSYRQWCYRAAGEPSEVEFIRC